MASITAAISAASTTNNQSSLTTAPFTPAAGDLLVAIGIVTDGQIGNFTDSQNLGGGTWPGIVLADKNSDQDHVEISFADAFAAATPMTVTLTLGGDGVTASGMALCVLRISGMSVHGSNALRQITQSPHFNFGSQLNQSGPAVPTPSFLVTPLTANPLIGALAAAVNPTGATEPSGWTKQFDIGYATPNTGLEVVTINSGFTAQPVPWGSSVAVDFCDFVIELDASVPPAPSAKWLQSGTFMRQVNGTLQRQQLTGTFEAQQ
jgi:hypothetical protein